MASYKNFDGEFDSVLKHPDKEGFQNIIYDQLSQINSYGLESRYGSQIALLTFLDKRGKVDKNSVASKTFSMLLREPFKLSLSTKSPADSPYVSMVKEFQNANKKRNAFTLFSNPNGTIDSSKLTPYDPINLVDDYSLKLYSGTEHPTFNLAGRIYMDKTLFKPLQDVPSNYIYAVSLLLNLVSCILPTKDSDEEIITKFATKFESAFSNSLLEKTGILKWLLGASAAKMAFSGKNGAITNISNAIEQVNEGTYGNNMVSFCIPWLFGNNIALGSSSRNTSKQTNDNGGQDIINFGNLLKCKCFVKHLDFKLSREYYVENTITINEKNEKEMSSYRMPSYIDINVTLESAEIPSVKTWMKNWLRTERW